MNFLKIYHWNIRAVFTLR